MKLLIIAFYFPPAGGGGVQRPLKLAGHLAKMGVDVHVLAPDDPRWLHRDPDLKIPSAVKVTRARYVGPAGLRPAEELWGLTGLERVLRKAALTPRRLLVPDENVPWVLSALPRAIQLIRAEQIDVVLTTSPPTSIHLIGAAASRITGVPWIADLRDSLVAKPDRRFERRLVRLKEKGHEQVARLVAREAAGIVAVTPTIARELEEFGARVAPVTIPNGCDFEEFTGLEFVPGDRFRITHTGSFFGQRSARAFLQVLAESDLDLVARFVGDFRAADEQWARQLPLGSRLELHPFVSHRRSLELQRDTEALLLLLPEIGERGKDVPSGKLYEYLAAERPILAAVPHDGAAAELVEVTGAGTVVPPDNPEAIAAALGRLVDSWQAGTLRAPQLLPEWRERLSRETRARELLQLLEAVVARRIPSRGSGAQEPAA